MRFVLAMCAFCASLLAFAETPNWTRTFSYGPSATSACYDVAVDSHDAVVVAGEHRTLYTGSSFVRKYGVNGGLEWSDLYSPAQAIAMTGCRVKVAQDDSLWLLADFIDPLSAWVEVRHYDPNGQLLGSLRVPAWQDEYPSVSLELMPLSDGGAIVCIPNEVQTVRRVTSSLSTLWTKQIPFGGVMSALGSGKFVLSGPVGNPLHPRTNAYDINGQLLWSRDKYPLLTSRELFGSGPVVVDGNIYFFGFEGWSGQTVQHVWAYDTLGNTLFGKQNIAVGRLTLYPYRNGTANALVDSNGGGFQLGRLDATGNLNLGPYVSSPQVFPRNLVVDRVGNTWVSGSGTFQDGQMVFFGLRFGSNLTKSISHQCSFGANNAYGLRSAVDSRGRLIIAGYTWELGEANVVQFSAKPGLGIAPPGF